jgi:TRAP-type C4-dicarboxylate transport system permease small subunit
MADKGCFIYLFVKASVLGWFFVMTPIFGPLGFLSVLFRFWRLERKKKKYLQQRKQSFART